jgi:signal transduction histidine kinase
MRAGRGPVVAVAVLAVTAIGLVDYVSGPVLSMSVFYLIPIAWVTVLAGRNVGVCVAVLAAVAGLLSDVVFQSHYNHRLEAAVNVALMFITLLVIVELVSRARLRALAALGAEQHSREFLAFAAHQLRTPLAGISASVDALMFDSARAAEREDLLVRLGAETARAGRLIHSLLRVARLDQHEDMPRRPTDLGALVQGEVDRMTRARPSVAWTTQLADGDTELDCNPDAVAEAVTNLLDNAGRHAHSWVTVAVRSARDVVEISVQDDGPGLPRGGEHLAFERFVSLDGLGGTGLGLPIAQGIIEAQGGGSLLYEAGSFVIRLPRPTHRSSRRDTANIAAATGARDTRHRAPRIRLPE